MSKLAIFSGFLGYDLDDFGAGSVRLRAVLAVLGARDPGPALRALLEDLRQREASDFLVDEPGIIRVAHYGRDEGDHLPLAVRPFALGDGSDDRGQRVTA